jgi:hypothetical protein
MPQPPEQWLVAKRGCGRRHLKARMTICEDIALQQFVPSRPLKLATYRSPTEACDRCRI